MKFKLKFVFFIFFLFLISYNCNAEEEKFYFVRLKPDISLFGLEEAGECIMNGTQLEECLESGIGEWYEEDYVVELFEEAESESLKWELDMINAYRATEIGCTGQNIRVGVIDSGVADHPALSDSILEGYNFLDNTTDVTDNKGHGTFVSGIITADENEPGTAGISPLTDIVPLKCFDNGEETRVSTIISAIEAAVDIYDCDIINMSFGVTSNSTKLKNAIQYAVDKGVIPVASAGNGGTTILYYPAAYDNVIGVGSVDKNKKRSDFSQYNSSVFVTAPGEGVRSTNTNGGYSVKNGTSFSAPLVSGMVAIMKGIDEDITLTEIMEILKETSEIPESTTENDYSEEYGYGIIDLKKCIDKMISEYDIFISALGEKRMFIYNNTDAVFEGVCLWAGFDKCFKDLKYEKLEIPPGKGIEKTGTLSNKKVRCFVWKGAKDITAISNVREMRTE